MKFNVGDRVKVIQQDYSANGAIGTVTEIDREGYYQYKVEFDVAPYSIGSWDVYNGNDLELLRSNDPSAETIRGGVLLEAKNLIEGDRNITYGEPTQNFANIAGMWNILFAHKLSEPFTPRDVAQAMIALKQCRTITQPKRDNFVDIAGYAAIGWEAEESHAEPTV